MAPKSRSKKAPENESAKKEAEVKKKKRKWKPPKLPDNSHALLYEIGKILKRRGDLEMANEYFDQAIDLKPPERIYGKILLAKSECKALMGDYPAASMNVRFAAFKGANVPACNDGKARAMYEMCEYEAALIKYHQANRVHPNKIYKEGILRCRQTIEECIGAPAGPVLKDMLRWIRIIEDNRQRTLFGTSHGSAPKMSKTLRPVSRTIIAAFLASGDIAPSQRIGEGGVILRQKNGSGIILPDQEEMKIVRKCIGRKMTRHYLGKFADDLQFIEKLVASTNQMDENCSEKNHGFWAVKDPTAALYSPANPVGSYSMINQARNMLAMIKGVTENLRSREPYHDLLARAKSYVERDKRMRLARSKGVGEFDKGLIEKKPSHNITWSKLEMARQTAWRHLEATREALAKGEVSKCLAHGGRARDVAETLPFQAFSLGRKETTHAGKSGYVRAIAREIGRAYLLKKKVDHSLTEEENRKMLVHLGLASKSSPSILSDDVVADSNFPFRDPHRIIVQCEKWLGMTSNEPKPSLSNKLDTTTIQADAYETSPTTTIITKTCGGELEKAWLFHEIGRCRLQIGHIELAKHWSRRAVAASRRALMEERDVAGSAEDEWGGTSEENQKGATTWLINSLILTARVEAMSGSIENAEAAMVHASEELKKRLPENEDVQEWIRFALRSLKWISQELSSVKSRLKRGSILSANSLIQLATRLGLPPATLQQFGIASPWNVGARLSDSKNSSIPRESK